MSVQTGIVLRMFFCVFLSLFVPVPGHAQSETKLVYPIKRLSTEAALGMARAALEACRKKGVQVGVTVVDRGGHAQVVLRDVFAPDLTLKVSQMKAYTAVNFAASTSSLRDNKRLRELPGVLTLEGGVPIQASGTLLGAIGVSGAPSGITDEKCAREGVDSLIDEIEMQD